MRIGLLKFLPLWRSALSSPSSNRNADVLKSLKLKELSASSRNLVNEEWFLKLRGGNDLVVDDAEDTIKDSSGSREAEKHKSNEGTAAITSHEYSYRTVQVQVIHRHGDRTPITPLKNEDYWAQQLVPGNLLEKVGKGTRVLRHQRCEGKSKNIDSAKSHAAAGRGPFGKLTKLGLLGMIQVGTTLKEDLEQLTDWSESATASNVVETALEEGGIDGANSGYMNRRRVRFTPKDIKVYSTDFARTIQSVQGVLVGFFPEGVSGDENAPIIDIDCRHTTSWMIPDPQPRQTQEQEALERTLAQRPHIVKREASMRPLAIRCTQSLLPLLGEGAFEISFGVEDNENDSISQNEDFKTLPWIQLTEITKCLSVRGMLPDSITTKDQEALSDYTAWKWFQSLRSPRLAYLSMRRFTETLVSNLRLREQEPPLILYSCHDSSLIGLLCALNLEQPSVWPEYGAMLKIELLERKKKTLEGDAHCVDYVLRFFLNGELLRSVWHDKPREEIHLGEFVHLLSTAGDTEIV